MEKHKDEACDYYEIHEDSMEIINKTMPEETELEDLADLFKIFGDSTRIRILFVLFETEACVCDLAKALNMTQSATVCYSINFCNCSVPSQLQVFYK